MTPSNPSNPAGGGAKLIVVAVVLAVVAVVLTNFYIEMIRREVTEEGFLVYRVTRPVGRDERLDKKLVSAVAVPRKFRDSFEKLGAVTEDYLKVNLTDRTPFRRAVKEGEVLTYAMFTGESGRNIDQYIRKGLRWVSLPVNSRTLPGGLHAGMLVDIAGTFQTGGSLPETVAVMERVEVKAQGSRVAVDPNSDSGRGSVRRYQTLTIEVTPAEAALLSDLQQLLIGEFELLMRNPADDERPMIPNGGINPMLVDIINRRQHTPGSTEDTGRDNRRWGRGR